MWLIDAAQTLFTTTIPEAFTAYYATNPWLTIGITSTTTIATTVGIPLFLLQRQRKQRAQALQALREIADNQKKPADKNQEMQKTHQQDENQNPALEDKQAKKSENSEATLQPKEMLEKGAEKVANVGVAEAGAGTAAESEAEGGEGAEVEAAIEAAVEAHRREAEAEAEEEARRREAEAAEVETDEDEDHALPRTPPLVPVTRLRSSMATLPEITGISDEAVEAMNQFFNVVLLSPSSAQPDRPSFTGSMTYTPGQAARTGVASRTRSQTVSGPAPAAAAAAASNDGLNLPSQQSDGERSPSRKLRKK